MNNALQLPPAVAEQPLALIGSTLIAVIPPAGSAAGGNTVTLLGFGFTGATQVLFGTTPATSFAVNSDFYITATVPSAAAGPVQVTVVGPGGTSNPAFYVYLGPTLIAVLPPAGPAAGGNTVTLVGFGFTGATQVLFGTTPATSIVVDSDTHITATVPPEAAGVVQVTVVGPAGTSNPGFYLYLGPTLIAVLPPAGSTAGGNTVTLVGIEFTGATQVLFGTTPATSFAVNSDTYITATVPPGVFGPVQVTVVGPSGTSNPAFYLYI